jgi:hypothetical protein
MAIITLNEVTVTKHVGDRGAFQVEEIIEVNGSRWTKRWTVWADKAPEIGAYVNISGLFGSKTRAYEAANGDIKHAVDLSINDPIIDVVETAGIPTSLLENELTDSDTPF